jgi:putative transposase
VLIVLAHNRRRVVHFNVKDHPTSGWTAQQMIEAFADGESPRFLIRDRDGVYGFLFREQLRAMDIEEEQATNH